MDINTGEKGPLGGVADKLGGGGGSKIRLSDLDPEKRKQLGDMAIAAGLGAALGVKEGDGEEKKAVDGTKDVSVTPESLAKKAPGEDEMVEKMKKELAAPPEKENLPTIEEIQKRYPAAPAREPVPTFVVPSATQSVPPVRVEHPPNPLVSIATTLGLYAVSAFVFSKLPLSEWFSGLGGLKDKAVEFIQSLPNLFRRA